MKHRAAIIAAIVGVALAGLIVLFATSPKGDDGSESDASPIVGKLAPQLTGPTLDGQTFDLDKYRGQWVLVNFFATWCPPCVQEHPQLVELSEDLPGQLQVVSVAFQDSADKVGKFFAEKGGSWPVLTSDVDDANIEYGVIKLPESYLIDPEGNVVRKVTGGIDDAERNALEAEVRGEDPGSASTQDDTAGQGGS